jgi:pimeloyl-ACP methyl ester carboxylesterase
VDRRTFLTTSLIAGGSMIINSIESGAAEALVETVLIGGSPVLALRRRHHLGRPPVLYVHGGSFPSALSVGYRFADGKAWEDALHAAGYDVWALDLEGFGGSERPAAFSRPPEESPIVLRSEDAAQQVARAGRYIREATGRDRIAIIAHSWGTIPAMRFATEHPEMIDRLALFAPILQRQPAQAGGTLPNPLKVPSWNWYSVAQQIARFTADTPNGEANALAEPALEQWGPAWLATDSESSSHSPPAVRIPGGPQADIIASWTGNDLYDPAALRGRLCILRGEWDSLCTAADVDRLKERAHDAAVSVTTIARSGHLAHLEINRVQLWNAANKFLEERS